MIIAVDGLDLTALPFRPSLSLQETESTLAQVKYLPSCRSRGCVHQVTMSQTLAQGSDVVANQLNVQILVYLPDTYVPRGTSSEAKTFKL